MNVIKKISLSTLLFALTSILMFGQVDEKVAKKSLKEAQKALGQYNLDSKNNSAKLEEGIVAIDKALQNDIIASSAAAWIAKGQIYNAIGNRDMTMPMIDESWESVDYSPGLKSYEAFNKALEFAEKKFEKEDALKGLFESIQHLNNKGIEYYNAKDFENAFINFSPILGIHDILKANDTDSPLDDTEKYKSQVFIHAFTALNSNRIDESEMMYLKLQEMGNPESNVFEGLYQIYSEKGDMEAAEKILFDGVNAYPDDTGLLFAQINHFLKANRTDELLEKLKLAIEKEPNNVSLYATLGNVYDNLHQDAAKSGNQENQAKYFDEAKNYYEKALEIDNKYVAAQYSIGALYYNQAANKTNELNELANDYSKEGAAKYEKLKVEIEEVFDQALPYFKKAEAIDPNDVNTLIALKEIFARKNDFDTSNEFKTRLENVQGGGKNDGSYFQ